MGIAINKIFSTRIMLISRIHTDNLLKSRVLPRNTALAFGASVRQIRVLNHGNS